jgi:predicted metal-dependent phosphoesterase TrpH
LHGLMTPEQYMEAMENLNKKMRRSRAGKVDGVLLATGPLILPLALWGVRHRAQTKRRKRLLKEGMHEFNMQYQELLMRWNRRPQSTLTIERRHQSNVNENLHASLGGGEQEETMSMVQATLVSDSANVRSESHQGIHNPQLQQLPPQQQQQRQQQEQSTRSNHQQSLTMSPSALV